MLLHALTHCRKLTRQSGNRQALPSKFRFKKNVTVKLFRYHFKHTVENQGTEKDHCECLSNADSGVETRAHPDAPASCSPTTVQYALSPAGTAQGLRPSMSCSFPLLFVISHSIFSDVRFLHSVFTMRKLELGCTFGPKLETITSPTC